MKSILSILWTILWKSFLVCSILLIGQIRVNSRCIGEHFTDFLGKSLIQIGRKIEATDAYRTAAHSSGFSNLLPDPGPKKSATVASSEIRTESHTEIRSEPGRSEKRRMTVPEHETLTQKDQESLMKLLSN